MWPVSRGVAGRRAACYPPPPPPPFPCPVLPASARGVRFGKVDGWGKRGKRPMRYQLKAKARRRRKGLRRAGPAADLAGSRALTTAGKIVSHHALPHLTAPASPHLAPPRPLAVIPFLAGTKFSSRYDRTSPARRRGYSAGCCVWRVRSAKLPWAGSAARAARDLARSRKATPHWADAMPSAAPWPLAMPLAPERPGPPARVSNTSSPRYIQGGIHV